MTFETYAYGFDETSNHLLDTKNVLHNHQHNHCAPALKDDFSPILQNPNLSLF